MKNVSRPLKAKMEENTPIDQNRYLGLCSYCRLAQNCTFVRDPARPVYQCEEFDEITYTSIQIPDQKNIPLRHLSKNPSIGEDPPHRYKGLCSNCDERVTCTYPKPEGGVWHCEEYR